MIGVEGTFEYIRNLDFTFGIVSDPNQKKGLLDSDGDGYPDHVERDFANDSSQWHEYQDDIENLETNPYCLEGSGPNDNDNNLLDACDDAILEYQKIIDTDLSLYELDNKEEVSGLSMGLTYTVNSNIKLYSLEKGSVSIAIDSSEGFTWPWAWYLRNFDMKLIDVENGKGIENNKFETFDFIILNTKFENKVLSKIDSDSFDIERLPFRQWYPENYRFNNLENLGKYLRDTENFNKTLRHIIFATLKLNAAH